MNLFQALYKSNIVVSEAHGQFEVESIAIMGKKNGIKFKYEDAVKEKWKAREKIKLYPGIFTQRFLDSNELTDAFLSQEYFESEYAAEEYAFKNGYEFISLVKDHPELVKEDDSLIGGEYEFIEKMF